VPAIRDVGPPASNGSAELLGQRDDDALGAADVAESIAVLVLRHLAEEFGVTGAQPERTTGFEPATSPTPKGVSFTLRD
jgi:hypothetical protein